jgi:heat shock protein HslJ
MRKNMQKSKRFIIPALVLLSIFAFGCQSESGEEAVSTEPPVAESPTENPETTPETEVKTIFVGPEKVDCVGVGPQECYQVKDDPNGEWQNFYDQIEGFEWEPGYTYELRVAVHKVENPPADASSLRYELIEVVDKAETPLETEKPETYITIEEPADGTELDASKPIKIRGMGAGLFEGNVVVQILDAAGNELAQQPTILQSPEAGTGGEGPWEVELTISIETSTEGKIEAFSSSPKDGSRMASDEVAVTFTREMEPMNNLENVPWILQSFAQQVDLSSLLSVHQVTAIFNSDEVTLNGVAGCNNYFTGYKVDGNQLNINTPIATTRMMCPDPQMALENAYLAALENVASFEISESNLEILDPEGETLLVFQVDPFSKSEIFTREELANTSYLNEFAQTGVVQLVNGQYREPIAEDSATELIVMLTNHTAFGDVAGDNAENAIVVLVSQPGGSGSFYDLAVVHKQDEALTNMASIRLGDRVQIKNMWVENGDIVVEMLTQGPDDPMCCPSQFVRNYYGLESGELILLKSEAYE